MLKNPYDFLPMHQLNTDKIPAIPKQEMPLSDPSQGTIFYPQPERKPYPYWNTPIPMEVKKPARNWFIIGCTVYTVATAIVLLLQLFFEHVLFK
jgi:hypothetical protein